MTEISDSGFTDFDELLSLVRRTRELLDIVVDEGELPRGGADYLAEATLPHLESVQAGFVGWLRSDGVQLAELQYLLSRVAEVRVEPPRTEAERRAAAAETLVERAAGRGPRLQVARSWNLAALGHARLVLAWLPRVPDDAVRFPAGRRSYADIPVPRGPAELAERLSELERHLWRAATGHPAPVTDPGFRRTYGFFDTADRLGWRAIRPLS
jgi:hypothetical protein